MNLAGTDIQGFFQRPINGSGKLGHILSKSQGTWEGESQKMEFFGLAESLRVVKS